MCIRDRLGREVIGFGGDIIHVAGVAEAKIGDAAIFDCHHACAGEEAARGAQLVLVLGHDEICLLYTSDAADERSSVDLGGRRIIKKKYDI